MAGRSVTFLCGFTPPEMELLRFLQEVSPLRGGIRDQVRRAIIAHAPSVPGFTPEALRDHLEAALVKPAKGKDDKALARAEIRELELALDQRPPLELDGPVDSKADFGGR